MNVFSYVFAIGRIVAAKILGKNAQAWTVTGLADDDQATNAESSSDNPVFGPLGHYAWPEPPTASSSNPNLPQGYADAVSIRFGDSLLPFGARDTRITAQTKPAQGALGLAHYGGGYFDLRWSADGNGTQVSISAPHMNGSGTVDAAHYLSMDPSPSQNAVILGHKLGSSVLLNKEGSVVLTCANGKNSVCVTNNGVTLAGTMAFVGGIVAGSTTAAQPVAIVQPLIDAFNSLIIALNAAFAKSAINGAPLDPTWVADSADLLAKIALLSTTGTATTLKASPT